MERINIVIDDDNAYFVAGLRFSITEYAEKNHKTVSFCRLMMAYRLIW